MSYVDPDTGEILDRDRNEPDRAARALEVQQLALLKLRDDVTTLTSELSQTVSWLHQRLGDDDGQDAHGQGERQWCWRDMDADRARTLWAELADWVGWLRGRYPLAGTLPGCWWRHPELVEELTALYRAWTGAVAGGTAGTYNAIEWHDRWLPGVLTRVKTWGIERCAHQRTHYDRPAGAYDPTAVDDQAAYRAMCADDVTRRRAQAATNAPQPNAMTASAMAQHLATGDARTLGDLPGSPIQYGEGFWRTTADGGYERITGPALVARLRHDAKRLAAADRAITAQQPPDQQ